MTDALTNRLVVHITDRERELIADYHHGQRIGSRAEAVRQILAAGFDALGLHEPSTAPRAPDRPLPTFPTPAQAGRPVLGERILPYLAAHPAHEYDVGELLVAIFGERASDVGKDAALMNLFRKIGWTIRTTRAGGRTTRTATRPD